MHSLITCHSDISAAAWSHPYPTSPVEGEGSEPAPPLDGEDTGGVNRARSPNSKESYGKIRKLVVGNQPQPVHELSAGY